MERELYIQRKKEFIDKINKLKSLPKVWEHRFTDGEDMRLWFNKISSSGKFDDFANEIKTILSKYNLKILTDSEKEQEFLNYIITYNQIPLYGVAYFSDNDEMHSWYTSYVRHNKKFETIVCNNLKEYLELDLAEIWPRVKQEFIDVIKKLKRVPRHGECFTNEENIDIRIIYDKLVTFDPEFTEKLLLHLAEEKTRKLSKETRIKELLSCISLLGYIPDLQESRFSDGTDMFTWYMRKIKEIPDLEEKVQSCITKQKPIRKVNIYLIPQFRKNGGKFYVICTNEGERLDLSGISTYEEAKQLDATLSKRGGVILKKDEDITSVTYVKGRRK